MYNGMGDQSSLSEGFLICRWDLWSYLDTPQRGEYVKLKFFHVKLHNNVEVWHFKDICSVYEPSWRAHQFGKLGNTLATYNCFIIVLGYVLFQQA